MTVEEMSVRVTEVDQRARSNTRRIDKLEQQTEAIQSLATSVEVLVNEQKHQTEAMLEIKSDVSTLNGEVSTLKEKPGKRWDSMIDKAVWAILAAFIAYMLGKFGL